MVGVARGHQRADTLKPYSQKTSQSNHTRTTALSNSMKLTQDRQVMVERSDRMWSTEEGNGKPLQYSGLENPMNSMKKQNGCVEEALQIAVKRREVKSKGEKERYTLLNAEFQRIARRERKPSSVINAKK